MEKVFFYCFLMLLLMVLVPILRVLIAYSFVLLASLFTREGKATDKGKA